MKVAVTSYTGEYGSALIKAALTVDCWVRTVDQNTYADGFNAGREPVGGPTLEEEYAWQAYVRAQITQGSDPYVYEGELENGCATLILIHGTDEQLMRVTRSFAAILQADATGQYCGDDQHYDYFPDAMLMLYQLCRALSLKGLWLYTRQLAWDSHWKADGEYDEISQWLPNANDWAVSA